MQIITTSDPVLVDTHFTFYGCFIKYQCLLYCLSSYISQSWNHAILCGVFHFKVFISFYLHDFMHCVPLKYHWDIHSKTFSYISCSFLLWFDPEILDIPQYHVGHYKVEILSYLWSYCFLSSLWRESATYTLLIYNCWSIILGIPQYHDGHYKLDILYYFSSYCFLSSLWRESGTYALLIYFLVLIVSLQIDQQLLLKKGIIN